MFPRFASRTGHYALLTAAWAVLCLPNLGKPSLWDIDEGNNSECSREMEQSGNPIVPTFNYQLREDKPALLYWLQGAAYRVFGLGEGAARLPSALAALLAVLATYELGRRTFGKGVGLLAGLVLASCTLFAASAHFANPDALLNACVALNMLVFWYDYRRGPGNWFVATGVTSGLAVLAKGPVGLILPLTAIVLFLLWRGELRRLLDFRLLGPVLAFLAVAAPWYVWVGLETKGQWLVGFFLKHHLQRVTTPLESHHGPIVYYLGVLIVGLAPWSIFLGSTIWHAWGRLRQGDDAERAAVQLLLCWIAAFLIPFSLARTKLPNYVLPLYPAAALLLAHGLERWRRRLVEPPAWMMPCSLVCLGLMGGGITLGLLVAGGALHVHALEGRQLPGLEKWAGLGGVFVAAALVAAWCLRRGQREGVLGAVAGGAIAFTAALAGWGVQTVDRYKAPRPLAGALPADQVRRDVRVAAYRYFQPSLVFYCQREVARLEAEHQVLEFLQGPLPSYLFVPADVWQEVQTRLPVRWRLLARHHDLYANREVVVVANR